MNDTIQEIEQRYGCKFRPANAAELAEMNENDFPPPLVEHFSRFALDESTDHEIIFPDVERAIAENLQAIKFLFGANDFPVFDDELDLLAFAPSPFALKSCSCR